MRRIPPPTYSDGIDGAALAESLNCDVINLKELIDRDPKRTWMNLLGFALTGNRNSVLTGLPRGYVLVIPRLRDLTRKYILGHPSGRRYKCSAEFVPHLKWLFEADSSGGNKTSCTCKLCVSPEPCRKRKVSSTRRWHDDEDSSSPSPSLSPSPSPSPNSSPSLSPSPRPRPSRSPSPGPNASHPISSTCYQAEGNAVEKRVVPMSRLRKLRCVLIRLPYKNDLLQVAPNRIPIPQKLIIPKEPWS